MEFDAFTSGFYSFPSLDAASQMTMNYYPDLVEGSLPTSGVPQGSEKARMVLTPTPGINTFCVLPKAPVRGMAAGGDGLCAVGGDTFYEVNSDGSATAHTGISLGNDGLPVQIILNEGEAVIMSAGYLFCDGFPTAGVVTQFQFSAQLNDLVVEPETGLFPGALTGDTGGIFYDSDVGSTVVITGGTVGTWYPGTYEIYTVNTDGSAFLGPGEVLCATMGAMQGQGYEWLRSGTTNTAPAPGPYLLAHATVGPPDYVRAAHIAYLDGTYFASAYASNIVYYSANEAESNQPGVSWDPLNFFTKEAYPDAVLGMIADHEQLYLFGAEQSTEVWNDTGSGTNPYQRNASYMIHYGCQAAFSVCRLAAGVAWIGGDAARGMRMAFLATGYVPQRISTAAIEKAWNAYTTVADAVAYTIIQDGHEFWVISFPTADATWVYDATLAQWHQRGAWNGVSGWHRHAAAYHACIGIGTSAESHYVGDWQLGNIYKMAANYYQDSGANIHRRRRAPHLSNEKKRRFYSLFELDADNNSDAMPDVDQESPRLRWLRLGASRDRIFQVDDDGNGHLTLSYSDDNCVTWTTRSAIALWTGPANLSITAAYLQYTEGTG